MFGKLIKDKRKGAGLTQEKFAELIGVKRQSVQKWESGGYPEQDRWKIIEDVLSVDRGWILNCIENDKRKEAETANKQEPNALTIPEESFLVPLISWAQAGGWAEITDPYQPAIVNIYNSCFNKNEELINTFFSKGGIITSPNDVTMGLSNGSIPDIPSPHKGDILL